MCCCCLPSPDAVSLAQVRGSGECAELYSPACIMFTMCLVIVVWGLLQMFIHQLLLVCKGRRNAKQVMFLLRSKFLQSCQRAPSHLNQPLSIAKEGIKPNSICSSPLSTSEPGYRGWGPPPGLHRAGAEPIGRLRAHSSQQPRAPLLCVPCHPPALVAPICHCCAWHREATGRIGLSQRHPRAALWG